MCVAEAWVRAAVGWRRLLASARAATSASRLEPIPTRLRHSRGEAPAEAADAGPALAAHLVPIAMPPGYNPPSPPPAKAHLLPLLFFPPHPPSLPPSLPLPLPLTFIPFVWPAGRPSFGILSVWESV